MVSAAARAALLDELISGTAVPWAGALSPHASLGLAGGAEVSGTGPTFARQPVTVGAPTAVTPSVATIAAAVDFGAIGTWTPSSPDEARIYSALTGGTLLVQDTDTAISMVAGNRALIAAGMQIRLGTGADGSSITVATLQAMLDRLLRSGAALTRARYLGLLNSGTELSGGNYARADTATWWGSATVATPSVKTITSAQTFQASATFTGAFNQFALYAATTGGSPIITFSRASSTIQSGDPIEIAAGAVSVSL